jgi:hypothetical protein
MLDSKKITITNELVSIETALPQITLKQEIEDKLITETLSSKALHSLTGQNIEDVICTSSLCASE